MRIKFSDDKSRVLFLNDSAAEYKQLMEFPAFLKEGPYFWAPAKTHVIYNLIGRLKLAFKKIAVDKDVMDFANMEMKLKELPEDFKWHTQPFDFQEIALRFLYTVGSGGLLLDAGLGKTKICYDYMHLMNFKRSLVLCPLPLTSVWEHELKVHRPELSIHVFKTTDFAKEWESAKDKRVVVLNYTKASLLKKYLLKEEFQFLHLDEFLIKTHDSARTKDVIEISRKIPYKCGGSGTLISNTILDTWGPVNFLEPALVGTTFSKFLRRHSVRNPRDLRQVVAHTRVEEARSILESCSIVMHRDQWLKLPAQHFEDIMVEMGEDQAKFCSSLSRNYIASIQGEYIEVDNALTAMSKMFQAAQGFVYVTDKEDSEEESNELMAEETVVNKKKVKSRRVLFFETQPKIDALLQLVGPGGKAEGNRSIIWFNLSGEFQLISEALTKAGHTFLSIKGGTKNIGNIVNTFNNDPSVKFLVIQAMSVSYGVTILGTNAEKLENSNYEMIPGISPEVFTEIFLSCSFSLEIYLQACARIHRIGQTKECHYYRIFSDSKVEKKILEALDAKMSIRKEMLVDIFSSLTENDE